MSEAKVYQFRGVSMLGAMYDSDGEEVHCINNAKFVLASDYDALSARVAREKARGDALYNLLLAIGEKADRNATDESRNEIDKDSDWWTLRRWCTEYEIEDYLKERAEYIATGVVKPGVVRDSPDADGTGHGT